MDDILLVVHGISTEDKAKDIVTILSDYKDFLIKNPVIIVSTENYKVIQIQKNLAEYNKSKSEVKSETKVENKVELKAGDKSDLKTESKQEVKSELKKDVKPELQTENKKEVEKDNKTEVKAPAKTDVKTKNTGPPAEMEDLVAPVKKP